MKSQKDHEKFIALRAEGLSIDKVSSRLGISRRTGILWEKQHQNQIRSIKDDGIESMLDKLRITKANRLARLGNLLNDVDDELSNRDLKLLSTGALLAHKLKVLERIDKLSGDDQGEKREDVIHALILKQCLVNE